VTTPSIVVLLTHIPALPLALLNVDFLYLLDFFKKDISTLERSIACSGAMDGKDELRKSGHVGGTDINKTAGDGNGAVNNSSDLPQPAQQPFVAGNSTERPMSPMISIMLRTSEL